MVKKFFIYKTINLISGNFYIGKHETINMNDGYLGSGVALNDAIERYGRENFKREILEFCSEDSLSAREEYWIKELNAVKDGYNLTDRSGGGYIGEENYKNIFGKNVECPYCGFISTNLPMMYNTHFENCKENPNLDINKIQEKKKRILLKRSKTLSNKEELECPWCRFKSKNHGVMTAHHFDNCKQNPDYIDKREELICPYCGAKGKGAGIRAYHFENCKLSPTYNPNASNRIMKDHVKKMITVRNSDPDFILTLSNKIKESWEDRPISKCKYCGLESKSAAAITRWHNENCNQNPNKEKVEIICIYCGFVGYSESNMRRFHFDNCKQNLNKNKS